MASKIIPFKRPEPAPAARSPFLPPVPEERLAALPEWLKDMDVAWIFEAAEQRLVKPGRQDPGADDK